MLVSGDAGGGAQVRVAGHRQRAHRHAVEAVGEVDDVLAAGDLAGDLQRGFDRVGAGRADELHDVVVQAARLEDDVLHRLQEALLGDRVQVERVGDAVVHDVVDQRALEDRVVVAVVQGAGAGQEVEVAVAVDVGQHGAVGAAEHGVEAAGSRSARWIRAARTRRFRSSGRRSGWWCGPTWCPLSRFLGASNRPVHDPDTTDTPDPTMCSPSPFGGLASRPFGNGRTGPWCWFKRSIALLFRVLQ